ncbi:MAG: hypothetical protein HY924_07405, partial [Elusimicrobia bacterium]|nr:hypothetical protein [Elusimicrobiota bacterium]
MKKAFAFAAVLGVCLAFDDAWALYFTSNSPVPEAKKAYMVFPADVIEGFDTGYRELRSILESHGFNVVQRRPGAGEILYLNDFKLEIGSGEYSAFVANGHAGDAGIAVEIYEDEQMRDSAYQYYLAHGFDDTQIKKFTEKREIWWIFDQPYAWVIAVTPTAIAQWAQFQKGTIASVLTCYSFSRLQDAFVAANASFFVGSVPAFYFADMAKFSTAFWGLIGGFGAYTGSGLPDSLAKRNFAVREAFDQVNGYLWTQAGARNVLGARSADGSCDSERLYNTPRIVSAKLTQSDIYDWTYADQTYPFNEGDYPGDRSAAAKNPAKSGPLGIRLQFSESMDPTWSGFNILLAPQSVGETVDYTNGAWSRTVLDNDTWIGSLTIPESGGLDGQANLVVKARDAFLDDSSSENTDGELDTDGDGAWNGSDFSVAIKIPPPPTLGIDDLYLSFSGTSELKPSTILPNSSEWGLGFAVTDLQSDLASFSVAPALKTNVAFLNGVLQNPPVGAATLPPGTRSISGGMSPVSDTFMPGHYLAAAANVAGRKTLAGFAISTITASAWWNPGTEATYNSTSGGFAVQESLRLTAPIEGLGLHSIEKIDPVNGQSLGYKEISGAEAYQPYSKSLPLTGMVTDRFYVRDTEGNTIFHTINMGADGAGIHDFLPNGGMTCSGDIDNGWSIKTLGGSGSCLSRVYSLSAEFSMLKGAVLLAGDWLNPWTGKTEYVDLIQSLRSLTSEPLENPGPLSEGQKQIGTFVVKMVDVVGGGESTLLSGTIFESPVPPFGTRTWAETVPHIVALPELFKLKLELHSTSPDTVFPWDCDQVNEAGTSCLLGRKRLPQITIAGYPILGVEFYEESGPTRGFEFAAGHTYAGPLGFGVEIGNFTTLQPGEVLSAVANSQPEPGWRSVPKDGTFDLWANGAFFKTPFELRLPFLDASLTSQQRENLRVVRLSGVQREIGPNLNYAVSNGKVSLASVDAFGRFMIMVPQYAGPQKVAANGIEFMSGQAGVTVRQVSVSEPAIVLAGLGAKGLVTVSPIFKLGPDGMSFSPSGVVKMTFSPEQLAVLGLSKDNIAIYQIGPDGSLELLSGQFRAYEGNYISAQVNRFSSYFAVLAQGTVPPSSLLPDVTPPVSGISFQPILSVQEGQTFVSTTSIVSLNAVDPYVADSLVSGVAATFFLLDQPFVSLEATPPTVYASTFALTVGTHAVTYFSQDWAGNLEAPKIASVTVLLADTTPPSTELGFEGYSAVQDDGGVLVTTETRIKLISSDPQVLGAVTSGADKAYYLVDTPFVDFAATPPQVFYASAPFALDPGTHTVTFFSQDLAGNMEEARSAQILVVVPEPAVNPAGQLAVVMRSSGSIGLSWTANGNPPYATYSVNYTVVESSTTCDFVPGPTIKNQFVVGTTASITGLLPGTPYWFTVCPNSLANACAEPVVAVTLSTGSPSQADPPYYSCGSQEPPPSVQYRGLSISADTGGNLWEVIAADSGAQLAKFDVAGAPLASVVLPGSTTEGNWTIRFDPEGNAYAVGGASSGVEEGLQKVAVYKVSSSGDVLLSSTVFENPWGLNDFAFDSAGDIWITGAVQTSGPPDFSGPVGISMGLWRFEPATGQLSLKSSYAGDSGFDAGFGVQLDGSGDIWVVGFSSVAAASGHNKLALALWKYDASGTSLLAGPFLRHGYMRDIEQDVNARLLASGDDLWVTATKTSAVGNL